MERWGTLVATLWTESVAGSPYAFSVYAPQLRDQVNCTQRDIQNVGAIGNLGLYSGILAGICFDAYGPAITMSIGAFLSLGGYLLLWAAVTRRIAPTVSILALSSFISSHGSSWLDTTAIASTVRNFPHDRGRVLGLMKSLFGLSASILTLIYSNVYKPDVISFIMFMAIIVSAVTGLASVGLRLTPVARATALTSKQTRLIFVGMIAVLVIAGYITALTLLQAHGVVAYAPGWAYGLLPLLAVLSFVLAGRGDDARSDGLADKSLEYPDSFGESESALSAHSASVALLKQESRALKLSDGPGAQVEVRTGASFLQGVLTLDFMLILFCLFTGTGSGLVAINNAGSFVQSLGAAADGQDAYVVLLSVFNCVGRQAFGALSDTFASRIRRPMWLAICLLCMCVSMTLMAFSNLTLLYVAVVCTGFAYGGFWSLLPTLIAERYGTRAFGALGAASNVASAAASYALNTGLAASVYTAHLPSGATSGTVCIGLPCYQATFLTLAALCAAGTVSTVYLSWRLRSLYDADGRAVSYTLFIEGYGESRAAVVLAGACSARGSGAPGKVLAE